MEIGQEYKEIEVLDYSHEGLGIVKVEERVIFVPNVLQGEIIDFTVKSLKKRHGFGQVEKIHKKSSYRVEPKCEHYYECGGCNLQHMNYEEQLNFKLKTVNTTLQKNGIDFKIDEIIKNEHPLEYRNKMIFKFDKSPSTGIKYIGMNPEKSNESFHLKHCDLQDEQMNSIVGDIDKIMKQSKETICTSTNIKGNLKQLILKKTKTNQILLTIVSRNGKFAESKQLLDVLLTKHDNIKSIQVNKSIKPKKEHLGFPLTLLHGEKFIIEKLNDLEFQIQTNSFFQVNTIQAEKLYNEVLKTTEFKDKKILDAYCGTGTIALTISKKSQSVYGIDSSEQAINDAKKNAKKNGIKNVKFKCSEVESEIEKLKASKYDVVIVDPPRKGLTTKFTAFLKELKVKELIYVSCAPSTLARDLKELQEFYEIKSMNCVDMFSQTYHVETIVKLKLK